MPEADNIPTDLNDVLVVATAEQCEALYQSGATQYQSRALGITSCLPATARAVAVRSSSYRATQQPWIIDQQRKGEQLRCLIWVDAMLEYFAGHFPGQPILPGVVQLEWSLDIAAQQWPTTSSIASFAGMKNLKFKRIVEPGAVLQLVLTHQPGKIGFSFATPTEVRSQGTLLYRV